jgi:hypothetical protein
VLLVSLGTKDRHDEPKEQNGSPAASREKAGRKARGDKAEGEPPAKKERKQSQGSDKPKEKNGSPAASREKAGKKARGHKDEGEPPAKKERKQSKGSGATSSAAKLAQDSGDDDFEDR